MIESGKYEFGPSNGKLNLSVYKDGVAKAMGHDLTLEVTEWQAEVVVDDDPGKSSVSASARTQSIKVLEGHGGVKALSDKDKGDIIKNIDNKILKTDQYRDVTFESKSVKGGGDHFEVDGDLTIMGNTSPATMTIDVNGNSAKGHIPVNQTDFGIKPFSAMMGALKIKPNVDITFELNM